jgi:hypothetical protein
MSHVVTIKTSLNNLALIKAALTTVLGLSYKENAQVRMWNGSTTPAEVVINLPKYDVGLNKDADGNYTMICDHYAWGELARHASLSKYPKTGFGSEQFTGILTQAVNIVKATLIAEAQGDKISFSAPDANGVIHAEVIQA